MQTVTENPFRIIGVLAGTSTKEELNKTKRLKKFLDAEQEPPEEYSFPALGGLKRTADAVDRATSRLNLNNDRVNAALFWFYNGRDVTDEPAFEAIKESDLNRAIEIWSKLTSAGEVNQKNSSAFHNLSSLKLIKALNGSTDVRQLEEALSLKLKFLESEYHKELVERAADETYKINKTELQRQFLKQVQAEVEKDSGLSIQKYVEILNRIAFSAKQDYLKDLVQKSIEEIERKVEEAKGKRKANKANGVSRGNNLYLQTQSSLTIVKSILGSSDLKYITITDKVSDEVLQCGIDYFNHYKDTATDPSSEAMDLFRKAKLLAVGSIAKQRCEEQTENLEEWIEDKPERDKRKRIKPELDALLGIFDEFDNEDETSENAIALINRCKPKLNSIKSELGSSDEVYLKISTRVAAQAQSFIISEVNRVQEFITERIQSTYSSVEKQTYFQLLKTKLQEAWRATVLLGTLDMDTQFKIERYNPSRQTLSGLCSQFNIPTGGSGTGTTHRPGGTSTGTGTKTNPDEYNWVYWVVGIIIVIILANTCN